MIAATSPTDVDKYHVSADSFNYDDRTQVINHYDTFGIFDRTGNIYPQGKKAQGIFFEGTRYINQLELRINSRKPSLLSSSIRKDNEVLSVDLANPDMRDCNLPENTVHIGREQLIRNGIYYEGLQVVNFSNTNCIFELSIEFGADFSDIFEIRGVKRNVETEDPRMSRTDNAIYFNYNGLDHKRRSTEICISEGDGHCIVGNKVVFPLNLKEKECRYIEYVIHFNIDGQDRQESNGMRKFATIKKEVQADIQKAQKLFAGIRSNNENFNNWITRSLTDMKSLLSHTAYGLYPYAGVPWYNTAFGRDGIITAMEMLWMAPEIARDALIFLANTQTHELNAAKDAEPGKIIHEMRTSEMANTGEVPFNQYYGTIDATPLFLMLAGMYYVQTADIDTIKSIWYNIKAAVSWIDDYGDIDGDEFVEYKNKSKDGLTNQGWKDSHDSIMYEDGELCEAPIALCEVQAYVYAAKKYASKLAAAMGDQHYADELDLSAESLKKKFNEQFWDEELGSFVLALDGNKKPCRVLSSNAGHCLFAGIADESNA